MISNNRIVNGIKESMPVLPNYEHLALKLSGISKSELLYLTNVIERLLLAKRCVASGTNSLHELADIIEREREKLNCYSESYSLSSPELIGKMARLNQLINDYMLLKELSLRKHPW